MPSEDRILVNVVALSRPVDQFDENNDGPKGLLCPKGLLRCGIEPARSRDNIAGLEAAAELATFDDESIPDTPGGRKGLVDGVGREVWDVNGCSSSNSFKVPIGGKREGTVPARALRPEPPIGPLVVGIRSGKPS